MVRAMVPSRYSPRRTRSMTRRRSTERSTSSNVPSRSSPNVPPSSSPNITSRSSPNIPSSSSPNVLLGKSTSSSHIPYSSRNVLLSATRFEAATWRKFLDQHQYRAVYRLLWVNRVMVLLRKEFKSREYMIHYVELLLGYEDFSWQDSKDDEMQYIQKMHSFTSVFIKQTNTKAVWQYLIQIGRSMDLLKDILRLNLVNGLPTIYWVDECFELFLLVGQQFTEEIRVLFQQLLDSWSQHLLETSSETDPIRALPDLPPHHISRETMVLAFGSNTPPGAVLDVFEGILDQIHQTGGLGLAFLPTPIQAYLKLLWQREVHHTGMILPGQLYPMSQNLLKLVLPVVSCTNCKLPKEMGTLFGLRSAIPGELSSSEGRTMDEILSEIEFIHGAFGKIEGIPPQLRTPVLCQKGAWVAATQGKKMKFSVHL